MPYIVRKNNAGFFSYATALAERMRAVHGVGLWLKHGRQEDQEKVVARTPELGGKSLLMLATSERGPDSEKICRFSQNS